MAQFVIDEQIAASEVLGPLRRRLKVQRLLDLRPGEHILDERIPEILLTLPRPTFITIDQGFWGTARCATRAIASCSSPCPTGGKVSFPSYCSPCCVCRSI